MITLVPTNDIEFVHEIMRNPDVYPNIRDDSNPENPNDFDASEYIKRSVCLKVLMDSHPVGVFVFYVTGFKYEAHTLLTGFCRGNDAINACKLAMEWIFDNTDCKEITSYSFSDRPSVIWMAKKVGLKETKRTLHPYTRNHLPVGVINFSILRPAK